MLDIALPLYDPAREWIKKAYNNGKNWEEIRFACKVTEEGLKSFLALQMDMNMWPNIDVDIWGKLVDSEKESEEKTKNIDYWSGQALVIDEQQNNDISIPKDPNSSWQLYKKGLLEKGLKAETVEKIERATKRLVKRLSNDTTQIEPIKGLVIGNVQSGKTANMAAVMAMAADWGWNMFIVLSGTIENLRQQTQNRLFNDLNKPGNIRWIGMEHLAKKAALGQRAQDLHFEPNSNERYFNVCLKNQGRLKKLIQWLQADKNKQKQMKILVIDDEADQAGINTADISTNERKAINRLICDLVNGYDEKSQPIDTKYKAMNYVGYTATPYANVLNDARKESLYPRNFISTLDVSKEYFGPQQIFGIEGGDYDGLDIVRDISSDDLEEIKDIHDGSLSVIPKTLQDSLVWFVCGVACMRYWKYKKPISMLIHTSQKTEHHQNIANALLRWIKSQSTTSIIENCKNIWIMETSKFSFDKFREQYFDYDRNDEDINKYPTFDEILPIIKDIINHDITNIPLGEDEEFEYHEGLHLCIDNCKNNGVNEDGMYVRLAYPTDDNMPSFAPAFIVIGGSTLSRGLTIEGLISTFFLRSVGQADTLMQMGRWFGYRKGYELIPRIWLTEKTYKQFLFLSALDQELRDEIHEMETLGKKPSEYGPKVKNSPSASFIRITAKNKMQSASPTERDYSGAFNQTYIFDNDEELLKANFAATVNLLELLGKPENVKEINKEHVGEDKIWRNVDFSIIAHFLRTYKFKSGLRFFDEIEGAIEWIEKMTSEQKITSWNVVFGEKKNTNSVYTHPTIGTINKVNRTRKDVKYPEGSDVINIGVLRDPKDIIADVDLEKVTDLETIDHVKNFESKYAKEIRNKAGLNTVPQLLLYIIDKDSDVKKETTRKPLKAKYDIVGVCVNIPGGKVGTNYVSTISIKMPDPVFDDNGDLEGVTDEH